MEGCHRLLRPLPRGEGLPPYRKGEQLPFRFVARWGHLRLSSFLNPISNDYLDAALHGEVDVGGICARAPMDGNLSFAYLSRQSISYCFDFDAGGRRLRFRGDKRHIRPWNLPWSHTTCYGELSELASGEPISTVLLRFPPSTLMPFLSSFRLIRRAQGD